MQILDSESEYENFEDLLGLFLFSFYIILEFLIKNWILIIQIC